MESLAIDYASNLSVNSKYEFFELDVEVYDGVVPEKKLYLAVLEMAIRDLRSKRPDRRNGAREWFMGREAPVTFQDVLDILNLKQRHFDKLKEWIKG